MLLIRIRGGKCSQILSVPSPPLGKKNMNDFIKDHGFDIPVEKIKKAINNKENITIIMKDINFPFFVFFLIPSKYFKF